MFPSIRSTARASAATALVAVGLAFLAPSSSHAWERDAFIDVRGADLTKWCVDTDSCFSPAMDVYYNRVDGLLFYGGIQYASESHLHPRATALRGFSSARGEQYYHIQIEQPLFSQDSFSFGVQLYDKNHWSYEDEVYVTDWGNNLHAFFLREDHRDYFRREGMTAFAQQKFGEDVVARVEYRSDDLTSVGELDHVWTVLDRDEDWRVNSPLTVGILAGEREFEGKMESVVTSITYDSRDRYDWSGWLARACFEYSGGATGGDYEFRKYLIDASRYVRVTSTQTLTLRSAWGLASGTDYPSHKLFHLGGEYTLRGYEYKEFAGKNLFFARIDYGVELRHRATLIYFMDAGQVWYGTSGFQSDEMKYDLGVGYRFEAPWGGDIQVDVARSTEEDADIFVDFSLYFE